MAEDTVGPSELADALGVSERQVYRLHQLGMPKKGRGEYPLVRCCVWYREHVLSPAENGEGPDLDEARLRKERAKAREAERKLSRRRREVVPSEIAEDVWSEANEWIRDTTLSRAPRMAEALKGVDGPREAEGALKDEVRDLLTELHRGPPGWSEQGREPNEEAA